MDVAVTSFCKFVAWIFEVLVKCRKSSQPLKNQLERDREREVFVAYMSLFLSLIKRQNPGQFFLNIGRSLALSFLYSKVVFEHIQCIQCKVDSMRHYSWCSQAFFPWPVSLCTQHSWPGTSHGLQHRLLVLMALKLTSCDLYHVLQICLSNSHLSHR